MADHRKKSSRGGGRRYHASTAEPTPENGLVDVLQDSYGFIRCANRKGRLFFHYSQLEVDPHTLNIDDCVEFYVATDSRTGKHVACEVIILPPGSVTIDRQPGSPGAEQPGSSADKMPAAEKGYGTISSLKADFGFLRRDPKFGDGDIFFHYSEVQDNLETLRIGMDVEYGEVPQSGDRLRAVQVKPLPQGYFDVVDTELVQGTVTHAISDISRRKGGNEGKLEYVDAEAQRHVLTFTAQDVASSETIVRKGDTVSFNMCTNTRSSKPKKRAVNVTFVSGLDSGASETGVVVMVKDGYGFIRVTERPARVFFHFSEMLDTNHAPAVGDEVQFYCIPDSSSDHKECAVRIAVLPKGTVQYETIADEVLTGFVKKTAHGNRPGSISLMVEVAPDVPDVSATESEEDVLESEAGDSSTVPGADGIEAGDSNHKSTYAYSEADTNDPQAKLRVGDKVSFQVATEKSTGRPRACNVALLERAPEKTYQGYVCVLKDDFGFVEEMGSRRMIFFHTSDVTADHPLLLGNEVEFTVAQRKGQTSAKGVKVLAPGTIHVGDKEDEVYYGSVEKPYTANSSNPSKHGGMIRHETAECTLIRHPFWIEALDHVEGDAAYPKIGDSVSFKLYASEAKKKAATDVRLLYDAIDESIAVTIKGRVVESGSAQGLLENVENGEKVRYLACEVRDGSSLGIGDDVTYIAATNKITGEANACRLRRTYSSRKPRVVAESAFGPIRQPRGPEGSGWAPRQTVVA